jgi:hypothetical protein
VGSVTTDKVLVHRSVLLAVLTSICALAVPLRADSSPADALFREGRQLLVAGKIAEACAKLEESQALEPSSGTLMNLAYCHAQLGKTASAWLEFVSAERQAIAQGHAERAREARRQAVALEPQLSHLTIRVTATLPGLVVRVGQQALPAASVGTPQPMDPGRHDVHVSAPGHHTWSTTIELSEPGERVLEVPALHAEPAPHAPLPTRPRQRTARRARPIERQRTRENGTAALPPSFWVSAATSVAAASAGSVLGVMSLSSYGRAEDGCPTARNCSDPAIGLEDRAHTQANVANVCWAVAGVSAALAAYFFFDAKPAPRSARLAPSARGTH